LSFYRMRLQSLASGESSKILTVRSPRGAEVTRIRALFPEESACCMKTSQMVHFLRIPPKSGIAEF
jgi:hypothetical protein